MKIEVYLEEEGMRLEAEIRPRSVETNSALKKIPPDIIENQHRENIRKVLRLLIKSLVLHEKKS